MYITYDRHAVQIRTDSGAAVRSIRPPDEIETAVLSGRRLTITCKKYIYIYEASDDELHNLFQRHVYPRRKEAASVASVCFCEECGAKLTPGIRFCEECGTPVPAESGTASDEGKGRSEQPTAQANRILSFSDPSSWVEFVSNCGTKRPGLVLAKFDALCKRLGCSRNDVLALLERHIETMSGQGVEYAVLDIVSVAETDTVSGVVAALRRMVGEQSPDFLLILGDETIVPVAEWENEAGDGDETVLSDFAYAVMDAESPWNGRRYDLASAIRVGRIPTWPGETLADFAAYFENADRAIDQTVAPYGLSALVWEAESNLEFGRISSDSVRTSPDETLDSGGGRVPSPANLLFFNLHGSDDTEYWYGQNGSKYPEAFSPSVLGNRDNPYVLGVEACYGARYTDGLNPKESILLTAIRGGCKAFLGSSKIAYGTPDPPGSCADFVVGEFVAKIKDGATAGDAFVAGLRRLAEESSMDDSDIKTLAEFALYGDPAVSLCGADGTSGKAVPGAVRTGRIPVPMPDVRGAMRLALATVDEKIARTIDAFAASRLFQGSVAPGEAASLRKTFRLGTTDLFQNVYSLRTAAGPSVAKVYFDERGNITKAVVSK